MDTLIPSCESEDDRNLMEPVKLGKGMELKYLPFSELVIPWGVCIDSTVTYDNRHSGVLASGAKENSDFKALKTMKRSDLDALKHSIARFGLLEPFEVAELLEKLDFFFGKGKYLVIDGQRRYFAIRELLGLPMEHEEMRQMERLQTHSGDDQIKNAEVQAQEQIEKWSVRDFVLIPCLVYSYETYLQMMRHSVESNKFNVKPSKEYPKIAEKMHQAGISDLDPDDLSRLWEIRNMIREEKHAMQKTLQEIRNMKRT